MKVILVSSRLFFSLVFVSLVLTLVDNLSLLNFPKSLLQTVTNPIQYGVYASGQAVFSQFDFIFVTRKLAQENKAIQKQLSDLLLENADLRKRLAENEAIIDQQNSLNPKTYDLIPARPIAFGRYLSLDRGLDDGVQVGQAVVVKEVYIGQIKQVSPKTSQVILASDPDSKVAVFAQSKDGRARGILSGQFGSELLMDKVLHQEPLAVDDLVYSEGTEGKLPKGLVVGRVSQVLERQNEVFKQAEVKSIFNIDDLNVVFILRG